MNHPGSNVGGKEKFHSVHFVLRFSGRLAFGTTPVPTSDSIACASSTSRRSSSNRKRDQQTRNAKHRNAIQLINNTCSIRGSIEPPPPITGWGCCVRKNEIEK